MDMATAQQRTMKDFLELYNKLVHHCFEKCVSNFNHAQTSPEELSCVTACTDKCITFNQRHMKVFVDHQNAKQKASAKTAADSQAAMEAGAAQATRELTEAAALSAQAENAAVPADQTTGLASSDVQDSSPKNVCGNAQDRITTQLALLQSGHLTNYAGKSIVEEFLLDSHTDKLKFV
ncbi:mitochondrial import inner membrane translocase subunit Tim10 B-like [Littorina saxatilis]|uniref:Tim10-like domain-containing protein n=1 Tax=Littorina saxatilis TaxID=31220 RepID=A0AAN9B0V0_9CAEN